MKNGLFIILFFCAIGLKAQNYNNNLWKEIPKKDLSKKNSNSNLSEFKTYELNFENLKKQLDKVKTDRFNITNSKISISFPNEDGKFIVFKIAEASVLSKELQEKNPQIKSYIGKSKDNSIIRFSISPYGGLKGMILNQTDHPTIINNKNNIYKVYSEKNILNEINHFECEVVGKVEKYSNKLNRSTLINGQLRIYRLALVSNGEYSQLVLNDLGVPNTATDATKKSAILGHLNSVMTTVNGIFERDASLTMQIVSNNENIIFLDPSTDGLSNYTSIALLDTNQQICDNIIGNSNYDIAHVLTTGNGGVAALGSVCNSTNKAKGTSGIAPPGYDPFDLQYKAIIHEMGHQYGATHTFNSCDIDNTNTSTSVETGAGTTIMSYSNSCAANQTIYSYKDLFFHAVSINQIRSYIQGNGNCATVNSTGNTQPIANAGNDFTIPKSTPFILEGTATDSNGSNLTYTWEQVDSEPAISPPTSIATEGPVFRWTPPSNDPNRLMPNLTTILNGNTSNTWEVLPSVSRTLDFVFLVRDNDVTVGETGADQKTVTVDENSGPFLITSHNTSSNWYAGSTQTINWDVAGTNAGLVNTQTVDILFSADGGNSFSTVLASNVSNNGVYSFQVPFGISTTNGRYMVRGHNNIFLDINNADIVVEEKEFLINIDNSEKEKDLCLSNGNSIIYNFTYNSYLGFNGIVSFSASNLNGASISFSPSSTSTNNTNITMTINNINSSNIGQNVITITGTSGGLLTSNEIILNVFDNSLSSVNLTSPANNSTNIPEPFTFEWNLNNNANSYNIQISTNNTFTNIIENQIVSSNTFISNLLSYSTTYYWRVKPINTCVEGNFSSTFNFTTQGKNANNTYVPDDAFEQALINFGYDSGSLDNYVPTVNITSVTTLNLDDLGIADLTGIEDFSSLQTLHVRNYNMPTNLQSLDLSQNTQLVTVYAYYNSISSIDVSNSPNLQILGLFDNDLSSIDVSNNPNISFLDLSRNNLTNLDVSQNGNLNRLECYDNLLSSMDVTNNNNLKYLAVGNTPNHPNNNSITSIDLSNNPLLEYLSIIANQISTLELSNKPNLERAWCADNNISSIDITGANSLEIIDLTNNNVSDIDLSDSPLIYQLQLAYNNLSCLDVTNNPNITHFYCNNNQITELDLTSNTALTRCEFQNNNLEVLNLNNGNNGSFSNSYSLMDARNNPNLNCIKVDDENNANLGAFPYDKWFKDNSASYSENCDYSSIDTDNDGVFYLNDDCPCTTQGDTVDSNGCSASQLSVDNYEFNHLVLYPNPVTNILSITSTINIELEKIEVYNLLGKRLLEKNNNLKEIDLSSYAEGIYLIKLTNMEGKIYIRKIIKK